MSSPFKRRPQRNPKYCSLLSGGICLLFSTGVASAQNTETLVVPPDTKMQAPLPNPTLPLPKADKPVTQSPRLPSELLARPLTINDTVAISLSTNRSLAAAVANLLRAQGRSHEARAAFNPTLGSTLTYLRLNQGLNAQIGPTTLTFVNEQQRTIGVQATLPIDISGILQATTDQAKFAEIASRLDINRVRNQVVQDIKTAFYDVLRAQALAAVATENLRNSQSRLEDAEKRFAAGVVARFDVIRAQTDVANAKQQLIQTRNSVSLAIASLNSQIGIDINTPLKLTNEGATENPTGTETTLPSTPQNTTIDPNADPTSRVAEVAFDSLELGKEYDKIQKEALETRPEIWQAEANISASKRGILLARRSELPSLGLNWQLSYTPDAAGFAPQVVQWQAVAQITLPLWDGATAKARREQARADIAAAEVSKRDTADRIILEVRQAYLNLAQARDRVIVSNQVLTQAREAFRLARVRYNAGVSAQAGISPLLEVSDAQAALTQAESNQVNALYDYNNSRARLDRAIGRYSYTERGQGFPAPPTAKVMRK